MLAFLAAPPADAVSRRATASRLGRSTPGRTPIRTPVRSCRRSRSRRRSRRRASASTGLRVRAQRQPHPTRARDVRGVARRRARTASPSRAAWPRRTRCCARSNPATTCCSATTRTAARSGWSRGCYEPHGIELTRVRPHRSRRASTRAWTPTTRLVWVETPTNPLLTIVDIGAVAELAHERGARRRRRQHVRHAVPAAAAGARRRRRRALVDEVPRWPLATSSAASSRSTTPSSPSEIGFLQNAVGAVPVARSTATSCCAASRRSRCGWIATASNAARSRDLLVEPSRGRRCSIPGSPTIPDTTSRAADARLRRHGVVPRRRRRGRRARVVARTRVFTLAESLGAVESLIEHPARMTHASAAGSPLEVDPALGAALGRHRDASTTSLADLRQALDPQ